MGYWGFILVVDFLYMSYCGGGCEGGSMQLL